MEFTEIGGQVTITLDMDTLEALARACRFADDAERDRTRRPYPYDVLGCAFTAAAMIARTHGDMPAAMTERLARIHKGITAD